MSFIAGTTAAKTAINQRTEEVKNDKNLKKKDMPDIKTSCNISVKSKYNFLKSNKEEDILLPGWASVREGGHGPGDNQHVQHVEDVEHHRRKHSNHYSL